MCHLIKTNGLTIKTKDGTEVLGSDFNVEIKELDESTKSFWATASTENPDRDNDIIRVAGWDLKNYKLNPVGLFSHNYFEHPHFKTSEIKIDKKNKSLTFKPIFDTHDKALITWNQYKNGFMTSFSVGFRPIEFSYRDPDEMWSGGREFTKQELLEISAVPVPAHPDARINMDGFIFEEDNLLKDGFSEVFGFDEVKNMWWVPIDDLGAYKNSKTHQIFPGVLAVTAEPLYVKDIKIMPAVGYFFEQAEGFGSVSDIKSFLNTKKIKSTVKRYYVFDYNEKGEFDSVIKAEVKDLEFPEYKGDNEADYKQMPECDPESPDYDPDLCDENSYIDENGCRKPKKKEVQNEDTKNHDGLPEEIISGEGNIEIPIEGIKFDKSFEDNVKSILEGFGSQLVELRELIKELKPPIEKVDETFEVENDFIEFNSEEFTSPGSQKNEDSEEIEFNPEEIKKAVLDELQGNFVIDLLEENLK